MAEFVSPLTEERMSEETAEGPRKYPYPEFAGWSGERYLKKLLRQILPMALYRTWEIFADHQAQGSDCYLGITRLAEIAGRTTRTMEKNLASLCAKHLLVERAERKVFRRADGTLHSRVVVVKDFRGLYALAHEYHEWLHAPAYIAPDRQMVALVEQDPHLVAKVRRFENYRRLLYHRLPGPATAQREEDRWFSGYQSELPFQLFPKEPIKGAVSSKRDAIPAKPSAKELPKDLAKGSEKRISEATTFQKPERDSVDSAVPSFQTSEKNSMASMQQQNRLETCDMTEGREHMLSPSLRPTVSFATPEPSATQHPGMQEDATCSLPENAPNQTKENRAQNHQQFPCRVEVQSNVQELSGLRLSDSFLEAIAGPFGDRNLKGTRTHMRMLFSEADLTHPAEVAMCLLRAYIVARDTRTIRPEHCDPATGQVNRMPLFCTMVQRLREEHRQGRWWDADWQQMEAEIASDACLAQWWREHQHQVSGVLQTAFDSYKAQQEEREEPQPVVSSGRMPATPNPLLSPARRVHLSQTDDEREQRAAYARKILRQLHRMALPLQEASVLWEHLMCGCPLYHRYKGREVCALCFPDPAWPEEVRVLLRSIVEREREEKGGGEAGAERISLREGGGIADGEAQTLEGEITGWTERDDAYANAVRLLDAMISSGYVVEVFLELIGDGYQVVVRGADGELICTCPEQVEYLIEQTRKGTL